MTEGFMTSSIDRIFEKLEREGKVSSMPEEIRNQVVIRINEEIRYYSAVEASKEGRLY